MVVARLSSSGFSHGTPGGFAVSDRPREPPIPHEGQPWMYLGEDLSAAFMAL